LSWVGAGRGKKEADVENGALRRIRRPTELQVLPCGPSQQKGTKTYNKKSTPSDRGGPKAKRSYPGGDPYASSAIHAAMANAAPVGAPERRRE